LPVYLGFGIKEPAHARMAAKMGADGIIIGSEFIRRTTQFSVEQLTPYIKSMEKAFDQ
ncbi:MAG: tryptophan synthase subunit alpha, partial [Bacillota bacterium]